MYEKMDNTNDGLMNAWSWRLDNKPDIVIITPDQPAGAAWVLSEIGSFNAYKVGFSANLAESASPMMQMMAKSRGMEVPPLPGVSFDFNTAAPAPEQTDDESAVYRKAIAVSPMQAGYAYPAGAKALTREELAALVPAKGD